uniref:Uncharacterized protein n=1 Tax=Rhynchophorus ferrugineus TaxID=354439 RepID=A0A834M1W9_RHYFE|nr:hypothetical protein GWI33_023108 [Rhynchophorus ferrugineus]
MQDPRVGSAAAASASIWKGGRRDADPMRKKETSGFFWREGFGLVCLDQEGDSPLFVFSSGDRWWTDNIANEEAILIYVI